ncbi:MAG: biotin/lipoyl-binding protein [Polyangiales bacterium]
MSDRFLITSAGVPILCGLTALVLLQRVPGTPLTPQPTAAASIEHSTSGSAADSGWIGVVVAGSTAELAASVSGRIERVFVKTGQRVAPGERLIQFDRSESANSVGMANAQLSQRASELARSQARAQAARDQLKRLKVGEAWLSKQELASATAEARIAEAELDAARASVGASRIQLDQQRFRATLQTLTAPFAGTVVALDVDTGDSVSAGQIVMRILSDDRQVRFAFPPGELPDGGHTRLAIRLAGTEHDVLTEVASVRPEVDPSAQLVFATAQLPAALPETARWIPGAAVRVTLAVTAP